MDGGKEVEEKRGDEARKEKKKEGRKEIFPSAMTYVTEEKHPSATPCKENKRSS